MGTTRLSGRLLTSALLGLISWIGSSCTSLPPPAVEYRAVEGREYYSELQPEGGGAGARLVVKIVGARVNGVVFQPTSVGGVEVSEFTQALADELSTGSVLKSLGGSGKDLVVGVTYSETEDLHNGANGTKAGIIGGLTLGLGNSFVKLAYDFESRIELEIPTLGAGGSKVSGVGKGKGSFSSSEQTGRSSVRKASRQEALREALVQLNAMK